MEETKDHGKHTHTHREPFLDKPVLVSWEWFQATSCPNSLPLSIQNQVPRITPYLTGPQGGSDLLPTGTKVEPWESTKSLQPRDLLLFSANPIASFLLGRAGGGVLYAT